MKKLLCILLSKNAVYPDHFKSVIFYNQQKNRNDAFHCEALNNCLYGCVCVCVPIHQGPSGVRGVRGEKVNTNDSRPLFQFVHVTMRASPHKHSAHVN